MIWGGWPASSEVGAVNYVYDNIRKDNRLLEITKSFQPRNIIKYRVGQKIKSEKNLAEIASTSNQKILGNRWNKFV